LTEAFFVFIAGLIELQVDAILSAEGVMAVFSAVVLYMNE
jgi:hypothetical protein